MLQSFKSIYNWVRTGLNRFPSIVYKISLKENWINRCKITQIEHNLKKLKKHRSKLWSWHTNSFKYIYKNKNSLGLSQINMRSVKCYSLRMQVQESGPRGQRHRLACVPRTSFPLPSLTSKIDFTTHKKIADKILQQN